jgi:hypothetical protein
MEAIMMIRLVLFCPIGMKDFHFMNAAPAVPMRHFSSVREFPASRQPETPSI